MTKELKKARNKKGKSIKDYINRIYMIRITIQNIPRHKIMSEIYPESYLNSIRRL
jgi:hypothetical protein